MLIVFNLCCEGYALNIELNRKCVLLTGVYEVVISSASPQVDRPIAFLLLLIVTAYENNFKKSSFACTK